MGGWGVGVGGGVCKEKHVAQLSCRDNQQNFELLG